VSYEEEDTYVIYLPPKCLKHTRAHVSSEEEDTCVI